MKRLLVPGLVAVAAWFTGSAAQTIAQPVPSAPRFIESQCAGGLRINVRFTPEEATVLYRGALYSLKQQPAASGYRYTDGRLTLTGKGLNSTLSENSGKLLADACQGGAIISGTVTYLPRIALPSEAIVEVQLQEVSRQDAPATVLATQTTPAQSRQVPIPWALVYDPNWLEVNAKYVVRARITAAGRLIWTSDTAFPVLQSGQPTDNLEIRVVQVSSPPAADAGGLVLAGTQWELTGYSLNGQTAQDVSAPRPTLGFSADGTRLSGGGGCNQFSGNYASSADTITVRPLITTLKACLPAVSQLEGAYLKLLQKAQRFAGDTVSLQITGTEGSLTFQRAAATGQGVPTAANLKLPGTNWALKAIVLNGQTSPVKGLNLPTLGFDTARLAGTTGCNRYSAGYSLQSAAITVNAILSTKIACASAQMKLETTFVGLLQRAQRVTVTQSELRIIGPNGTLVFDRLTK